MAIEIVEYGGWEHNARLTNGEVEAIVTLDVGPRIIRYGRVGGPNLMAEMPDQMGGSGEGEWQIRGGHRLWAAPESADWSYELDNGPAAWREAGGALRTEQEPGPTTGLRKRLQVRMLEDGGLAITHVLENAGDAPITCAPWALTATAQGGEALVPMPERQPFGTRYAVTQTISLWCFTDLSDPRITFGSRYLRVRQVPGAEDELKLGLSHDEGWAACRIGTDLLVKCFKREPDAAYTDGGANLQIYSDGNFMEVESLGAYVALEPGQTARHDERWALFADVADCPTDDDVDRLVRPLAEGVAGD